jgi:murein DD-endopeptidase MepM/ murein hydrolase activator NlpD
MMKKTFFILLLFISLSLACFPSGPDEEFLTPSGVAVEMRYRTLQPGEMVVVAISDGSGIKEAEVRFLKRKHSMGKSEKGSGLLAFIGLGLDLEPGLYPMEFFITKSNGESEYAEKQVSVSAKTFPLKIIWVDERYVTPPPEFQDRIRMEAEILKGVFDIFTDRWLGEGQFILPTSSEPEPNFGQRRIYNNEHHSSHGGVDIPEPSGTPVRASNSGKVVLAGNFYFAGKMVIIDHGIGLFTLYCHFSKIKVKRGDLVKKGEIIGEVGASGRVTGPHLHWGVKVFGNSVDPLSLLSFTFE